MFKFNILGYMAQSLAIMTDAGIFYFILYKLV
jgi:hypothetical protein